MKELLKNKLMICLLIFVILVTYANTIQLKKYEDRNKINDVVININ